MEGARAQKEGAQGGDRLERARAHCGAAQKEGRALSPTLPFLTPLYLPFQYYEIYLLFPEKKKEKNVLSFYQDCEKRL